MLKLKLALIFIFITFISSSLRCQETGMAILDSAMNDLTSYVNELEDYKDYHNMDKPNVYFILAVQYNLMSMNSKMERLYTMLSLSARREGLISDIHKLSDIIRQEFVSVSRSITLDIQSLEGFSPPVYDKELVQLMNRIYFTIDHRKASLDRLTDHILSYVVE